MERETGRVPTRSPIKVCICNSTLAAIASQHITLARALPFWQAQ
ncbi:unnamed protein product [Chondrus crispus]|uniref:Uncharacterized protein n=1 Tax=Chondrus crispus TaxID=2769 RepID=R7Q7Y2_CHOCR|nr:unnamed protein product [Chondrus crispus]CDF34139.1 unnamed protein product [Chondrus crispus]|eukprot:XP_005713958.1 unnamed protein product [Chondrus crispus]